MEVFIQLPVQRSRNGARLHTPIRSIGPSLAKCSALRQIAVMLMAAVHGIPTRCQAADRVLYLEWLL